MNHDEFAFFNQQLASMLRAGIPLEGALKQLCDGMRRGKLRAELELLEKDLANGVPLDTALASRKLPDFYVQMLQIGVRGNNLPGVLVLVADYYQRIDSVMTRLKGLMVYPLIVLLMAFAVSGFLSLLCRYVLANSDLGDEVFFLPKPVLMRIMAHPINFWMPSIITGSLLSLFLFAILVPGIRASLRWRLPAFRDAKLSQVASSLHILLESGANLDEALRLVGQMEAGTRAGRELGQWQSQMAAGHGKFTEMAKPGKAFPPLFLWLVANAGEDLAAGFKRTAEIYRARANFGIEAFLYAVLPVSILVLGSMIVLQVFPFTSIFLQFIELVE